MEHKGISAYAFERACSLSNGYLGKQARGSGSIGSDVIARIHQTYPDLSLIWLITGKGEMLFDSGSQQQMEEAHEKYEQLEGRVVLLEDKIKLLENAVADKERIISLLQGGAKKKK